MASHRAYIGPLVILLAVNDLYFRLYGNCLLYADDTSLFSCKNSREEAELAVSELYISALQWFMENKLALNDSKV